MRGSRVNYKMINIMTDWIIKNRYAAFLIFCLYTIFTVFHFNTVGITMFGPKSQAAFEDATVVSLFMCFLLKLVSMTVHRKMQKTTQEGICFPFLTETVISGFFFAAGSFFCLKGMTIDEIKNASESYQPVLFTWSQICILLLLVLSVVAFYLFFRFDKKAFFSFIGYILALAGLLLLYYGGYRLTEDDFLQLRVLFFAGSQAAASLTYLIIAGIFWIISISVNQTLFPKYHKDLVWTETLFFGFLVSAIGLVCLSVFYNRDILFYYDFHYESVFMYACFLFLCLQGSLWVFEQKNWATIENGSLKIWAGGILFLNFVQCLFLHQDYPFMIKSTLLCLGIYFIWAPAVNIKLAMWENRFLKTVILLFLSWILTGAAILVLFQIFLYGIWLQDTVLWKYIVLFQEHKYICVFLLSVVITALFGKRYSFEKAVNVMCRGIILCIMAWLTAGIVQETIISLLTAIITMGKLGSWASATKEMQGMWLGISLMISSVISLFFSIWQCKKGIGRIIVWTLISNILLYKGIGFSFGIALMQLFVLKNVPEILGIDGHAVAAFSFIAMPYLIIAILLGLSFFFICFSKLEQSVLPRLMNCRTPNSEEKENLGKISAVIFDKTGIPDSAYRILICRSNRDNLFAIGRNTVAIPKLLLENYPVLSIAALMAHELGHIKQRDSRYQFIIDALNLPVHVISKIGTGLLTGQKKITLLCLPFFFMIVFSGTTGAVLFGMSRFIFYFLLQTAIIMIRKQDFRESELAADAFAMDHGLGNELKTALLQIGEQKRSLTLWELLMSDYPDFSERIRRLDAFA